MEHSFDTDLANEVGIEEAIIFNHLVFWILKNQANDKNFFDGEYWTYNSTNAFREIFFYMSPNKVRTALDKLETLGYIKTGNYNSSAYDRTKWYALDEKGKSICGKMKFHLRNSTNGIEENRKPIPDINTYINTDINTDNFSVSKDTDCQTNVRQEIQKAINAWNSLSSLGYAKISRMSTSSQRYVWLKARIAEYGIEDVLKAIENVRNSTYLRDAAWFAFDWFVRPNNFPKVLEGKYNSKNSKNEDTLNASFGGEDNWQY